MKLNCKKAAAISYIIISGAIIVTQRQGTIKLELNDFIIV